METIAKLKFLIGFYLAVLFFLLLCVVSTPLIIRHGLSLSSKFIIEEETFESTLIIVLFVWLERRRRRPVGFYCALLPLLYAPVRFFLDFLRAPPLEGGDVRYGGLTPAQWSSVLMLGIGFAVWQWGVKPRTAESEPSDAGP